MTKQIKKLSLISLILMIFTSVFGFANGPSAFYLMGYSAIPWYIAAALLFFIPYALMMAEYGSAYRKEQGGIYSWMKDSVGPRYAFIGTFMWFSSYIIWMVGISSKVWIPLSTFIFGGDKTQEWRLLSLTPTQTVGLLAILWMIIVTLFASKGLKQITKVTAVGGVAVMGLNVVLIVISLIILILNGGQLAQPLASFRDFAVSPNPNYVSPLAILSFFVFAIFAYGGIEAVGGLVDQTKNPKKNFPKGIMIAAIVISIGYAIGIFLWGVSANWLQVLSAETTNLGNITYVLMNNLGFEFGRAINVSNSASLEIGIWFARVTGLSMFLAYTGAFFTLIYTPLKAMIQGTPKELWPQKVTKLNRANMPGFAMWIQCFIVCCIILFASFGGSNASAFYNKLTLMANVSMTLPYLFLSLAFPFFKNKTTIERPFTVYKTKLMTYVGTIIVACVVGFANVFTIIQPALSGKWTDTIWMIAGPVCFSVMAILIYEFYMHRMKK